MKVHTINTGFFLSDGGAMFGLLPKKLWEKSYSADSLNRCNIAMRSVLAISNDKKIIIDPGAGDSHLPKLKSYNIRKTESFIELLSHYSLSPLEITDVILSHLHFDHCGESVRYDKIQEDYLPSFPNAIYHISKEQWVHAFSPGILDSDAYFKEDLKALSHNKRLHIIDNTQYQLDRDFILHTYSGHTPGQLVSVINDGSTEYVFAGDVLPTSLHIHLRSISAFDLNAELSVQEKERLLNRAAERNQIILFYHDSQIEGVRIKKSGNFFKIKDYIKV